LTLRAENLRPTLVLLDPKAKIMFTSTTQRYRPNITPKSRPIETGLITSKKQSKYKEIKPIVCKQNPYTEGRIRSSTWWGSGKRPGNG
jgi:hypothetical protein